MADETEAITPEQARSQVDQSLDRHPFQYNDVKFQIREMNVEEYGEFSKIDVSNFRDFIPFVIPMVELPDGRQVYDETHVDSLLEQPSGDSVVGAIQTAFKKVNGFKRKDDEPIDPDTIRAVLAGADDDAEALGTVKQLVGWDPADQQGDEGN